MAIRARGSAGRRRGPEEGGRHARAQIHFNTTREGEADLEGAEGVGGNGSRNPLRRGGSPRGPSSDGRSRDPGGPREIAGGVRPPRGGAGAGKDALRAVGRIGGEARVRTAEVEEHPPSPGTPGEGEGEGAFSSQQVRRTRRGGRRTVPV